MIASCRVPIVPSGRASLSCSARSVACLSTPPPPRSAGRHRRQPSNDHHGTADEEQRRRKGRQERRNLRFSQNLASTLSSLLSTASRLGGSVGPARRRGGRQRVRPG